MSMGHPIHHEIGFFAASPAGFLPTAPPAACFVRRRGTDIMTPVSASSRLSPIDSCRCPDSLVVVLAFAVGACTPLNGPRDAAADAPPNPDTSADAPAGDTASDTPVDAGATGCGRFTYGPKMVEARMLTKPVCVDSTEVTQAQYQQFLTAKNGKTDGQDPECAWNVVYAPSLMCTFDPVNLGSFPVNGVDWCDAKAFCKWAGKRLCGGGNGGHITTDTISELQRSEVDEWTAVCSHNDQMAYPYGPSPLPEACNGGEHSGMPRAIVAVGTTPGCEGGFPGIFDLLGNVHEWEDACYPFTGTGTRADKCWFRGGSYHDLDNSCTTAFEVSRDYVDYLCDIGFRCCADP